MSGRAARAVRTAVLLAGLAGLAGACARGPRTFPAPPDVVVTPAEIAAAVDEETCATPRAAINAALLQNPRIRARARDVRQAAARAGMAGDIRAPEIQIGLRGADADGEARGRESATRTGRARELGVQTEEDIYPDYREYRGTRHSVRQSQSTQQSTRSEYGWEHLDDRGWEIGLRLFPPNPWEYRAEVSEAAARLHVAEARLREEQLDLARDAALAASDLAHARAELEALRRLERLCVDQARRAAAMPMADRAAMLRRELDVQSRIARVERRICQVTAELELLGGRRVDPDAFRPDWNWLPATNTDAVALRPLLAEAATRRPDVALAFWQARELQAEMRLAQSASIPWLRQVEVAYGTERRESRGGGTANQSAYETTTDAGGAYTDYADGHRRIDRETASQRSWSQESESGTYDGTRDTDEWLVQAAVSLPVFNWLADDYSTARHAVGEAWKDVDDSLAAARRDLLAHVRALRQADTACRTTEARLMPPARRLSEQLNALQKNGLLSPAESIQLSGQVLDIALDCLAARRALLDARIRLWIACGAPLAADLAGAGDGAPAAAPVAPP